MPDKMHGRAPLKTTRVQVEKPEKSMARLIALKEITEASSYAEVLKNALRLYEAVIAETESGKQFYVKGADGNVVPYRIFL